MSGFSFLSVCSGIEAASVAWAPLGWKPWGFSEIEPFPCALLSHRYPDVPNHGDMTRFKDWPDGRFDLLCGGTPCQSFSVAGLRKGLSDPRGNLALTYLAIANRYRPRWLVWENVPGVLSSNGGRDFGALIGAMGQLGYGFAWRVLDAQYVRVDGYGRAVPQSRDRVFLVGYLGDWRPPAAVLFEPESLRGCPKPHREGEEGFGGLFAGAPGIVLPANDGGGGGRLISTFGGTDVAPCLIKSMSAAVGTTQDAALIAVTSSQHAGGYGIRRLSPREFERIQGFPDDYTAIPWRKGVAPDGPRYKALGNSWAVNCARWVGQRIALVDGLIAEMAMERAA